MPAAEWTHVTVDLRRLEPRGRPADVSQWPARPVHDRARRVDSAISRSARRWSSPRADATSACAAARSMRSASSSARSRRSRRRGCSMAARTARRKARAHARRDRAVARLLFLRSRSRRARHHRAPARRADRLAAGRRRRARDLRDGGDARRRGRPSCSPAARTTRPATASSARHAGGASAVSRRRAAQPARPRALADGPDHPLTARVLVNRLWQDSSAAGSWRRRTTSARKARSPTHPELLDWLARDFVEHGWDIKRAADRSSLSADLSAGFARRSRNCASAIPRIDCSPAARASGCPPK